MDQDRRAGLMAELTQAQEQEATARGRIKLLGTNIDQIRRHHGNPYFYGSRPGDDPQSETNFTGYNSHDPAFILWQEWRRAARHVALIQTELSS